jgi:polyvinyl alcohol dehydrogenase (cytochrome)
MRYQFFVAISVLAIAVAGKAGPNERIPIPLSKSRQGNVSFTNDADTVPPTGRSIFLQTCASCHRDSGIARAPALTMLSSMTPRSILAALDKGKMQAQAVNLSEDQRMALAQWITQKNLTYTALDKTAFTTFSLSPNQYSAADHSGWGVDLEGTGFQNTKLAGISTQNVASLKLKWAFAFPDATIVRSKPAVLGDWLIVGGQYGDLYAINRQTGKLGWTFSASAAIRGAITVKKQDAALTAYFADYSTNVYAVDALTGKQLWNNRAGFDQQSSCTGSVVVYGNMVYVPISSIEVASAAYGTYPCCSSSGGIVALDAVTGKEVWRHRVIQNEPIESGKKRNGKPFYGPSGAPVWCSPTIDVKRGLVFIGTGENYSIPTTNTSDAIQALDLKTGKLVWNFQATNGDMYNLACPSLNNCPGQAGPDLDFGMAPILVKRADGQDILVAGQKSGMVYALSPDMGKLIWKQRIGKGGALGGIHWGMCTDGRLVYAANSDFLFALDKRDTSIKSSPGLYALDLKNGEIIWKTASPPCQEGEDCLPFNSAAPTMVPGIVFAGSLDGHIRAYGSRDGKILWDFNTVKDYETTDGIKGRGGALDGPAPVIAAGMLFVNSGYGMFGETPGNVLLAFEVDSK